MLKCSTELHYLVIKSLKHASNINTDVNLRSIERLHFTWFLLEEKSFHRFVSILDFSKKTYGTEMVSIVATGYNAVSVMSNISLYGLQISIHATS